MKKGFVWLVLLWGVLTLQAADRLTLVLAGETQHSAALEEERQLHRMVESILPEGAGDLRIAVVPAEGLWLLELGISGQLSGSWKLLEALQARYPGMVTLRGSSLGGGMEASSLFFLPEWWVLGLLASLGLVWGASRLRRLRRLDSEQRRLNYRQRSLWARVREEGDRG